MKETHDRKIRVILKVMFQSLVAFSMSTIGKSCGDAAGHMAMLSAFISVKNQLGEEVGGRVRPTVSSHFNNIQHRNTRLKIVVMLMRSVKIIPLLEVVMYSLETQKVLILQIN